VILGRHFSLPLSQPILGSRLSSLANGAAAVNRMGSSFRNEIIRAEPFQFFLRVNL